MCEATRHMHPLLPTGCPVLYQLAVSPARGMEARGPRTEGEKRRSQRPGCSPRGPKCLTQPTCPWEAGEGQSGRHPGAPSWQPPRPPQLAFPGVHMRAMPSLTLCCHCPEMLNHF